MFVKSYIAKEMPEAIERIRKELGPDAIILSNRQIRGKGFAGILGKKLIEVTVAYEPAPGRSIIPERNADRTPALVSPAEKKPVPDPQADNGRMDQLYDQLAQIKGAVQSISEKKVTPERKSAGKFTPEAEEMLNRLIEREVHSAIAKKIVNQMQEIITRFDDDPKKVAESLVLDMLGEPASIKLKKYRMNILMLLGPTGVGKTTTIVKLAGMYALDQGLKVGFINTDTYRVAAQEQLRTYADIMGVPICTIYSPDQMENALLTLQDRDVVLIDTAGKCATDKKYREEIETYIKQSGADDILLAVSASMSYGACRELISNYSFLKSYKLIITKMDEVSAWGSVLNIATLSKGPIAFVTTGQNVPYDIAAPDAKKVAKNVLESVDV